MNYRRLGITLSFPDDSISFLQHGVARQSEQTLMTTPWDGGCLSLPLQITDISALTHPVMSWFLLVVPIRLNGGQCYVNRI